MQMHSQSALALGHAASVEHWDNIGITSGWVPEFAHRREDELLFDPALMVILAEFPEQVGGTR
jgi:hypothetical protein